MFKKILTIAFISLAVIGISLLIKYLTAVSPIKNSSIWGDNPDVLGTAKESVFKEEIKPIFETPARVEIASAGIKANLVNLGITSGGSLDVPKDWSTAGWYEDGAKAGEPGNLIIDGHYDTSTGAPAAFGKLKNVKTDDIVTVFDSNGRAYRYKVTEISSVDIKDPARTQIFESNKDNSYITLITCGGIWLGHTYSERLVVKGVYVD